MEGTLYLAPHNLRFTALDLVNVQPSNSVYLARIRRNMTKQKSVQNCYCLDCLQSCCRILSSRSLVSSVDMFSHSASGKTYSGES